MEGNRDTGQRGAGENTWTGSIDARGGNNLRARRIVFSIKSQFGRIPGEQARNPMSIVWLKASVLASDASGKGRPVPRGLFLNQLTGLKSPPVVAFRPSRSQWQTALVTLMAIEWRGSHDDPDGPNGSEAFCMAIQAGLKAAGEWLRLQSPSVFTGLRTAGFRSELYIEAWIDSDQFDVELPVNLVRACSRHRLAITINTND
jgi:hypothetical protein